MEIQKAIEHLKLHKQDFTGETGQAIETAISAMLELQQYKQINISPEQISKVDELYLEKCIEINELKKPIMKRLQEVRTIIAETEQMLLAENHELNRFILEHKDNQKKQEENWLLELLHGKEKGCHNG